MQSIIDFHLLYQVEFKEKLNQIQAEQKLGGSIMDGRIWNVEKKPSNRSQLTLSSGGPRLML